MDNGTMIEAFKYLKYSQLAKNSLVSKLFRDLTQTHRHSLALLCVDEIIMKRISLRGPANINVFDKDLSPEEYDEWVNRNQYSKEAPLEDSNRRRRQDIFKASAELSHENWPLFQHFVRLITDPFIYIRWMDLIPQNEILNLLVGAVNSDRERLQCGKLTFRLEGNVQKFMSWIKNNVRCDKFQIISDSRELRCDEGLPDFFLTGANCTSKIYMEYYEPSDVIVEFAQKFMDLKTRDDYKVVEFLDCNVAKRCVQELKRKCAKFIVEEENDDGNSKHVFEFVNNDIGKKMQLTAKIFDKPREYIGPLDRYASYFVIKIQDL
ncbi:hypothetical protein Ddc_16618 [Ditylenchus destructor]|nr:hypothetical protein Ddc_16618 [Ditylenchus destructor]